MNVLVGTSGWSYSHWRPSFYPKTFKQSQWLAYYASKFNTVEINNSFYMAPQPNTLKLWANMVPSNFIFAVKAWGMMTHRRKLKNCEQNLLYFFGNLKSLGNKCGPILFQLPPNFHKNFDRLKNFIKILPKGYRYCFEFRHHSWWSGDIFDLLNANDIAFCIFELGMIKSPRVVTTDFIYIRLHGEKAAYVGNYKLSSLQDWRTWIKAQNKSAHVYFDNTDVSTYAIQNASSLIKLLSYDGRLNTPIAHSV